MTLDLASIKVIHRSTETGSVWKYKVFCAHDQEKWPCTIIRLVEEVERLQGLVDIVKQDRLVGLAEAVMSRTVSALIDANDAEVERLTDALRRGWNLAQYEWRVEHPDEVAAAALAATDGSGT